jgi:uncharacterized RDD family membrane protein YckC
MDLAAAPPADTHAYARFTRRLQAVLIDTIIFMLILVGALTVAVSFKSDNVARILGFTVVATWLLYEPGLVSMTGATIGHHMYNMRVVDDRGGNVGFGKAVLRVVLKTLLSWYSFITMATTSRHQAVHDLLTRSTVQIRDIAKAQAHHFAASRQELSAPSMPSKVRRTVVIAVFLLAIFVLFTVLLAATVPLGLVSERCIDGAPCSVRENVSIGILWIGWFGLSVGSAIFGWRGRLWGAQTRR